MSSQTPHTGRADTLHPQVQDFAHEHAGHVVLADLVYLQRAHGARYWIRCSGRMWIATARVDDDTEPTIIRESAAELAAAMSNPGPRIGRWQPLNPDPNR